MFGGLSPQRRTFVLGSAGLVIVLVVVVALVAGRGDPGPRRAGVPVILVHGYGGSPASMATLAAALRHEGRTVTAVALPHRGEAEIGLEAQVLAAAVRRTGAAQVDLVGFSAGSIVVRAYAATEAGAGAARRIVLLGAPNHGARLASLAISTDPLACIDACEELTRGSGFLRALNSRSLPSKIPITSIWTGDDKVVTPPHSAVLPGATNVKVQRVCSHAAVAHGDLVTNPVAIGLTIAALRGQATSLRGGCKQIRQTGADALSS
jgi:triacylglycerol lipase